MGMLILRDEPWIVKLLQAEGREEYLTTPEEEADALIPLDQKSREQIKELAKGLPGYKGNMSTAKMIELIQNESST